MTEVTPRGKSTPLNTNPAQAKEWMSNIPNIDDIFTCKSYDELSTIVNNWLNGEEEAASEGTEWSTNSNTESGTSSNESSESSNSENYSSLDDAFADLMD